MLFLLVRLLVCSQETDKMKNVYKKIIFILAVISIIILTAIIGYYTGRILNPDYQWGTDWWGINNCTMV